MTINGNIAVIGAGTMGNGIAHVFAQNGFKVTLIDISQEQLTKAIGTITKNLDRQLTKGAITEEAKKTTLSGISTNTDIAAGVKGAQLVIEAATELNGVWTPLTNTPAINGNNYQITVPIDLTGNKFYRVRKK
mgnify:CR=1 FL=1